MNTDLRKLLEDVKAGVIPVNEAELLIKKEPFIDIDFAKIDLHRKDRTGVGEVVYGAGKTPKQIAAIVTKLREASKEGVLITRLSSEKANELREKFNLELTYSEAGRIGICGSGHRADGLGTIAVVTGGTSDLPVAEEAALTAEFLGNKVERVYDVGVAGLHRLMSKLDILMDASVVIAIAGMEGALASVVGGLVSCPVIAVPASVGYGASFGGISALLSMLNSCASGVTVVNIDNGFGAAFSASLINHMR